VPASKKRDDPRTQTIAIEFIDLPAGHRLPTQAAVERLASSMKQIGLRTPITVRYFPAKYEGTDDTYQLVTGAHRLAAAKQLGWDEIEVFEIFGEDVKDSDVELWEIDENLMRVELTDAEEAAAVSRRKEIYEKLMPQAKQGATGGTNKGKARNEVAKLATSVDSFTKDTADKTGKAERTIRRAATRGKKIGVDNLNKIVGTSLDKGTELDALARLDKEKQADLVARASTGETVSARHGDDEIAALRQRHAEMAAAVHVNGNGAATTIATCPHCGAPSDWRERIVVPARDAELTVGEAA
jgi:ParB/RepB/Spo0J family partition protein